MDRIDGAILKALHTDKHAVHYSSEDAEWLTPLGFMHSVYNVLGSVDLDPCAEVPGQAVTDTYNVKANMHYTHSGLTLPWDGKAFMNPPYGRGIDKWVEKFVHEAGALRLFEGIALVPARTDTSWWRRISHLPVCFVHGRLKFINPKTHAPWAAPFPSAVVYQGVNFQNFLREFSVLGEVRRGGYIGHPGAVPFDRGEF